MKIVHLSHNTPGRNARGGGLVFAWQNIVALSRLGHEVHLIIAEPQEVVDSDLAQIATSVTYCTPILPNRRSLDRLIHRVFRPETLMFRFPDWMGVRDQVQSTIRRIAPDAVWADWIGSLMRVPDEYPVVYGHLDFLYQLQSVRAEIHRGRLRRPDAISAKQLERLERDLVARCAYVVSVSATDTDDFERLGVPSCYMPVVGQPIATPPPVPAHPVRAFLLGRTNTAMNAARRTLRDEIWSELGDTRHNIEWHQLGEQPQQPNDLWRWVEREFTIHGYVEHLGEVLRPGDLCLVPYRHDTGFRAKFVTAAGFGMVNIGYQETFACSQEFTPGVDCLAATDTAHFAELLRAYASDPQMRARLSAASRAVYNARFSLEAQLPRYESVLDALGPHAIESRPAGGRTAPPPTSTRSGAPETACGRR